jgi:CoA:oxalate CoA-transferase
MTLNLKSETGKALFLDLIQNVDVLVENFRPGTMERLGLGYETLKQLNPGLIYAAASGFGQTGPYSSQPAYDGVVQAMGGIMSITGQLGGEPTRVGTSIGDIAAGLFTAVGILAAVIHRDKTGQGQMVDVAMLDCQVALLENAIARYTAAGEVPGPIGNRHPSITPFEPFATSDGQLMVAVGNNRMWSRFCEAMGNPELASDPQFMTNALRTSNYEELRPLIASAMIAKSTVKWVSILESARVPHGPINSVDKVVTDPQVLAREMVVDVEHPVAGLTQLPGIPIKMDVTPGEINQPAPLLGQHTQEILSGLLGYDAEKIARLEEEDIF